MDRLWAPWRTRYVTGLAGEDADEGCFLCAGFEAETPRDALVLGRRERSFVIMNRFPYNTGHLMIASAIHQGEMEAMDAETSAEMWDLVVLCKAVLGAEMHAHGFNVGINQGRCAGAGITDHLHIHIVPRWDGDTNFMPVVGEAKVMSQSLEDLYDQLLPVFAEHGLDL